MSKYFGAIEFGGTKTIALIAESHKKILSRKAFPTQSPEKTLAAISDFFHQNANRKKLSLERIGVGCFGPLDLNLKSKTYGFITTTPKPGWEFYDIGSSLENISQVPVRIETDVNAAALGEFYEFRENPIQNLAYITIGTGIGAGLILNGKIIHGLVHPEFGHILIPHDYDRDPFHGICPFHKSCLEGLASGPAVELRWQIKPENLSADHPAWELEADYIGYGLANLICTVSPERIILGGGVMNKENLINKVRLRTLLILNNYVRSKAFNGNMENYIIKPQLIDDSGIIGALRLAMDGIT